MIRKKENVTRRWCASAALKAQYIYIAQTGVRHIIISVAGLDCMDPSTFRIMFDLHNTDSTALHMLRPIGDPWSFFSRMRIMAGGQILEDIDVHSKVHEMFNMFSATDSRQNDYAEGFGNSGIT
jgi:hypothetical protein